MMAELIDRKERKAEVRELLGTAQVSPKAMLALYLGLVLVLNIVDAVAGGGQAVQERNLLGIFVYVLTTLLASVLSAGFSLYCMAIRRGERAEYLTLFDGFSLVGKIIGLSIMQTLFISLWSMLFVIPGIVAAYRYRFAVYNLLEDPGIGIFEALNMSKRQTLGYKSQLFVLDWSYMGWMLLGFIPAIIYFYAGMWQVAMELYLVSSVPAYVDLIANAPLVLVLAVVSLWDLAVGLFYMPNLECVRLSYFETAKHTSGVGLSDQPPRLEDDPNSGWTGGWGQM